MAVKVDLTEGDVKSLLIKMTTPMILGLVAIMAVNLVDTFFVGQLGTNELAAMGFIFPVIMVMNSLGFGIGTGASSLIARAIGRQDQTWVRTYSTQAIIIALVIGLVIATLGVLTIDPLFLGLGASPELLPLIHDYMEIWYWGNLLIMVPMVGNAGIRATGNTKLPSYIMVVVAIVKVILGPVMIFGLAGFPRLELQGAALSTTISYSIACVVAIYILKVRLNVLMWDTDLSRIKKSWVGILGIGVPAAGTNLITPLSVAITTWLVAKQGTHALAGFSVGSRIEAFYIIVLMALASTIAPFAGQNWGARKIKRVKLALKLSFIFSLLWGALLAVVLWFSAGSIAALFSPDDPLATSAATRYLHIMPITLGMVGVLMMVSSVANGVGRPGVALALSLLRLVVVYLPIAWIFAHEFHWGLDGIYYAIAISNVVVGLGAWWWSTQFCANYAKLEQKSTTSVG